MISQQKKQVVFWAMVILGAVMIALGVAPAPNLVPPPIVTGIGFWVLAWGMR